MTMRCPMLAVMLLCGFASVAFATNERIYTENGVTYRETRTVRDRYIPETKLQEQKQTYFVEQINTEHQTIHQQYQVPITEYKWEAFWVNTWNPFSKPYMAYRPVPQTRMETRTAEVKMPVTQRKYVPQERTVQVPVTTTRKVQEEFTSKVVIGLKGDDSQNNKSPAPEGQSTSYYAPAPFSPPASLPASLPAASAPGADGWQAGGISQLR